MPLPLANPGLPPTAQSLAATQAMLASTVAGQPADPNDPTQMFTPQSVDPTQQQISDVEQAPINQRPGLAQSYAHVQARRTAPRSAGSMAANRSTMQGPQAQHLQQYRGNGYVNPGMVQGSAGVSGGLGETQEILPGTEAATMPGSYNFGGGAASASPNISMIKGGVESQVPASNASELGPQPGGGRTVQLIRGGQESYQHFNAKGEQEGQETPTAKPEQAGAGAGGFDPSAFFNQLVKGGKSVADATVETQNEMDKQTAAQTRATTNAGKISPVDKDRLTTINAALKQIKPVSKFAAPAEREASLAQRETLLAQKEEIYGRYGGEESPEGAAPSPDMRTAGAPEPTATPEPKGMPTVTTPRHMDEHGIPHPPSPGVKINGADHKAEILQFLQLSNNDPAEAKRKAAEAGWGVD